MSHDGGADQAPESRPDPWLEPEALRAAQAAGRTPRQHLADQFEAERELLRTRVRELRANLQARRVDLRRLRATRASEDAIATVTGNIERLRGQIADLIAAYEALEQRRDAALRALPGQLNASTAGNGSAQDAVAEAERVLREARH
jgi:hypothetical protein